MKYENLTWEQFKDKLAQNPKNKEFLEECKLYTDKINAVIEEKIHKSNIHIT